MDFFTNPLNVAKTGRFGNALGESRPRARRASPESQVLQGNRRN